MSKTKTKTNSNNSNTENNTQRIGRQTNNPVAQTRNTRQTVQISIPVPAPTVVTRQMTPARQPVTITVRSTGEEINRVLIERSGYHVVRYDSRYHVVRGNSRVAPYILGHDDTDDVLGVA
jgi:hypothetical protein